MKRSFVVAATAAACLSASAHAQLGVQWAEFKNVTAPALDPMAVSASSGQNEVDFAWGDLDRDGWTDLVVVRKQPFTQPGARTNLLLMNVAGVLTDQTAMFATQSDVAGDQGFLTQTNDRDVALVDVDGDGWLDVVTATSLGLTQPKHVGHPRVYRNLGADVSGAWLGLKFESARSPQITHPTSGLPKNPRFMYVAAGDVTGDGLPDLYFGDHDSSPIGGAAEILADDVNDRLWINDGFGYFQDESNYSVYGRVDSQTTTSGFAINGAFVDLNDDGAKDLLHAHVPVGPRVVANYNTPSGSGHFSPPHVSLLASTSSLVVGDLNRDGRVDYVAPDALNDRYKFNTGVDVLNRVLWSAPSSFLFAAGGDEGFAGQGTLADLDGDGWEDVVITDVDQDVPILGHRYCHVYHCLGGTPGAFNIQFRHERQLASTSLSTGWRGVPGMLGMDLQSTFDVAPFDIDNDGDIDLVLGRMAGMAVWQNQLDPICQTDLGFAGPGTVKQTVCGQSLGSHRTAILRLAGAAGEVPAFLAVAASQLPTFIPELEATLVPFPPLFLLPTQTAPDGTLQLEVRGGGGPLSVYTQWIVADPGLSTGWAVSNALRLDFLP